MPSPTAYDSAFFFDGPYTFDGGPVYPPAPTWNGAIRPGQLTYYSFDVMTLTLLAELPFAKVTFSQRLNTPGSFTGTLKLSDRGVANLDPIGATNPSKTLTLIDLDGQIIWGGLNSTRTFSNTTHGLTVAGRETWAYFTQRLQAADYTVPNPLSAHWNANPADACQVAAQIVADAIAVTGSAFSAMGITIREEFSNPNPIACSYPLSQLQTVDSIVSTLATTGYETGFDFGIGWEWSNGQGSTPVPTLFIDYPRRGLAYTGNSPALYVDAAMEYTWPEDATQQANSVVGTASGSGAISSAAGPARAVLGNGYPLLESTTSYSNVSTQAQLDACTDDDWALLMWPVVTATVTLPLLGDPVIGSYIVGDDMRLVISPDERFPSGVDTNMRCTGIDATVADDGLSTQTITLGSALSLPPVPAPPN